MSRLELIVLLRVSGHSVAEGGVVGRVHGGAVDKSSVVEVVDLSLQFHGVGMPSGVGYESVVVAGFVAAEHEQVCDAQKTQVDQRILCFGLSVAAADYVRNGRNAVALLEGGVVIVRSTFI